MGVGLIICEEVLFHLCTIGWHVARKMISTVNVVCKKICGVNVVGVLTKSWLEKNVCYVGRAANGAIY